MSNSAANRVVCPFCAAAVRTPPLPPGSNCTCPKCNRVFPLPGGPAAALGPPAPVVPTAPPQAAPPPPAPAAHPGAAPAKSVTPPAAPAKPPLIPLQCKVCGTRMYANREQLGKSIRCPDCHSAVEVKSGPRSPQTADSFAPPPPDKGAAMEHPAGEDDDLELTPEDVAPRPHVDLSSALRMGGHKFDVTDGKIVLHDDDPPQERTGRPPLPDQPHTESAEWDRSQQEVKTFTQGIIGFFLQAETLTRVIAYAAGGALLSVLVHTGVALMNRSGGESAFGAMAALVAGLLFGVLFVTPLAVVYLRIIEGTANGSPRMEWPDLNFLEWFAEALLLLAAAGVAGAPGGAIAFLAYQSGALSLFATPVPVGLSELMLLPLVLLSMIEGGSIASVYSPRVAETLSRSADGILAFGMQSALVIGGIVLGAMAQFDPHWLFPAVGAAVMVLAGFIYARLLGRLVWYCDVHPQSRERGDDPSATETTAASPPADKVS